MQELDNVSRSSRESVAASDIKQVAVLDWDDCLRDEKGLNYQLMHNALAVAARNTRRPCPNSVKRCRACKPGCKAGRPQAKETRC